MKHLLLIAPLFLSACSDNPRFWRESEIREVAEEEAIDAANNVAFTVNQNAGAANQLSDKVDALESRIDELEYENAELRRRLRYLN